MLISSSNRFTLLMAAGTLLACTTNAIKRQQTFDFNNIGRIEVQVSANDPATLQQGLVGDVIKNLAGWDYPVGGKDGKSYSHILKATVGTVTQSTTPPGFSFSSGNSDPRALEFQKTDVLPISCRLTSIAHPEQTGELNLGFAANQSGKLFLAADKLADHISTACFNLLTEVKWPQQTKNATDEKTLKSPNWMPEIRIEAKETTAKPVSAPTAPPKEGVGIDIDVKTNTATTNEEPRKQIIIYNKGTPLILDLGYERR